jgi:hypothetical protein
MRKSLLLTGTVGLGFLMLTGGCGDDNFVRDVSLPRPDRGFQLNVGPFQVIPNSEVQDCYYFKVPIDAPMYVHRIEVALNPGSHHMNLFKFVGANSGHTDGEIQRGCWDAVAFESWDLVYNSQNTGTTDWTLPPGVSHYFEPGEMFMLQTHYVNATTQKTTLGVGKVVVNFYEADPADALNKLGSMFANNRGIRLPVNQESSFTAQCLVPNDVNFVAMSGHFHSRGEEFDIGIIQNAAGDGYHNEYTSTDWANAPFTTFSPGEPCPAGGGLQYTCKFFNNTNDVITFGPHVEFQEHCNVFAYYYPALETRGAIYCF